jgi:predicted DNA-binding transcriptional regulator AlpA
MTTRLFTKQATAELIGVHPSTVMRLVRTGQFPRPVKIGRGSGGAVRFLSSDVECWIESRKSGKEVTS